MSEGGNRSQISAAVLDKWKVYCQSDSLSERGLRELFAQHGLKPGNQNRLSNYNFFVAIFRNRNERVTEGIIRLLLEYFPDTINDFEEAGLSPLYYACNNNTTLSFIQLIVDAYPDSVRSVDDDGCTPLHLLCGNNRVDDTAAMQVLILLIDMYPEAVRLANNEGNLPIHLAGRFHATSLEFFRVLVEAYPRSVSIPDAEGKLPLHYACSSGSLATVEYLYQQYPDAINHAATGEIYRGYYPIHGAISDMPRRNYATALEVVKFLLNCDPNQKLIQLRGKSLLHHACCYHSSKKPIQLIKVLFDAHPEAIENNGITSNIHRFSQQVQAFINGELVYSRQAKNLRLMMTPDDNGRLPLHTALQNNVRLGSIKLLVKGNPSALRTSDNNFAMPLHIACQHHGSTSVVQYLIERDSLALEAVDRQGNTVLHYACRRAKHDMIALLLAKSFVFVSKRNGRDKLPIHLLWESNEVSDRGSLEYMESVFRLIRADPATINQ